MGRGDHRPRRGGCDRHRKRRPRHQGRKPSGPGDIVQFEIEWKADAARGSIEAQFRLGELYEQLRGNYLEAESWYARAAERGSIQALYRLALIALAGNGDIAPDPVTAYKWAVLASDPNDQWGRLAEDLRSQLEAVLTAAERGDAKAGRAVAAAANRTADNLGAHRSGARRSPRTLSGRGGTGCGRQIRSLSARLAGQRAMPRCAVACGDTVQADAGCGRCAAARAEPSVTSG